MKTAGRILLSAIFAAASLSASAQKTSGNPVFEGRYADPEGVVFGLSLIHI